MPRRDQPTIRVDISAHFARWIELMECHQTQLRTRRYIELQTARARLLGIEAGVEHAQALYATDDHAREKSGGAAGFGAPFLGMEKSAPAQDWDHLLSADRRERHPRDRARVGAGAARTRGSFLQFRASGQARSRATGDFVSPGDRERIQPLHLPRLHPAAGGEDGADRARNGTRHLPRALRGAARDRGLSRGADARDDDGARAENHHHAARNGHDAARAGPELSAGDRACPFAFRRDHDRLGKSAPGNDRHLSTRATGRRDPEFLCA